MLSEFTFPESTRRIESFWIDALKIYTRTFSTLRMIVWESGVSWMCPHFPFSDKLIADVGLFRKTSAASLYSGCAL